MYVYIYIYIYIYLSLPYVNTWAHNNYNEKLLTYSN